MRNSRRENNFSHVIFSLYRMLEDFCRKYVLDSRYDGRKLKLILDPFSHKKQAKIQKLIIFKHMFIKTFCFF